MKQDQVLRIANRAADISNGLLTTEKFTLKIADITSVELKTPVPYYVLYLSMVLLFGVAVGFMIEGEIESSLLIFAGLILFWFVIDKCRMANCKITTKNKTFILQATEQVAREIKKRIELAISNSA